MRVDVIVQDLAAPDAADRISAWLASHGRTVDLLVERRLRHRRPVRADPTRPTCCPASCSSAPAAGLAAAGVMITAMSGARDAGLTSTAHELSIALAGALIALVALRRTDVTSGAQHFHPPH